MGAYHENMNEREEIQIRVINPLHAIIETETSIFRMEYIEDPYEPNGQFEIDVKMGEGEIPIWTSTLNNVPRDVIRIAVAILSDDAEADPYRVVENNNNLNDPEVPMEPEMNYAVKNNSNTVSSPVNGGRRKQTRRKRKVRKA